MNAQRTWRRPWLAGLLLVVALAWSWRAAAEQEEKFDVLQIGTRTYTNVTVTTRAKNYVFILHSTGMANIKLSELSPEMLERLGYTPPKPKTNMTQALTREAVAKLDTPEVKELQAELTKTMHGKTPSLAPFLALLHPKNATILYVLGGLFFAFYLFDSCCAMLICRKTGKPGGVLAWIPCFRMIPLFRAAGMSPWWFLAYLLPGLNLLAFIMWSIEIAQARGKSVLPGILMILPPTTLFAYAYLAFSGGGQVTPKEKPKEKPELMALETA